MRSSHRLSRIPVFLAPLLALVLVSCQSSAPVSSNQAMEVSATVTYDQAWKRPDSLTWAVGAGVDNRVDRQSIAEGNATAEFPATFQTSDTIRLGIWISGLRFAIVPFLWDGKSTVLQGLLVPPDPIVKLLLQEAADSSHRRHDTLVLRYAKHLVDGDSAYKGFPGNCPTGIDTAVVLRAAILYIVSRKRPIAELSAKWSLTLDSANLVARIRALVDSGKAGDSALIRAFPPYPVRLAKPVSIPDLEIGASAVAVKGAFVGDSGLARFGWKVEQGSDDRSSGFQPSFGGAFGSGHATWDLESDAHMTLSVSTAPAGDYVLRVWMQDAAGRADTGRAIFKVAAARDRKGPDLTIVDPQLVLALHDPDSTVLVKVKATDSSGIDSIAIQGVRADSTAGIWSRKLTVPVNDTGWTIRVVAYDRKGNSTEAVLRITRIVPGTTGPQLAIASPDTSRTSFLGPRDSTLYVRCLATSPYGIDSVVIGGAIAVQTSEGVWSRDVPVPSTGNNTLIRVDAYDKKGGRTTKWLIASRTRTVPTIWVKPSIPDTAKGDPVVRGGILSTLSDSIELGWTVTGDGQACRFWLDHDSIGFANGKVVKRIPVAMGESSHMLLVRFDTLDVAKDTVKVHRYPHARIRRTQPVGDTIGDSSVVVTWRVWDAKSVVIDGKPQAISPTDTVFSSRVTGLRQGQTLPTSIVAFDSLGSAMYDTARISRLAEVDLVVAGDTIGPVWDSRVYTIRSSDIQFASFLWSTDSNKWYPVGEDHKVVLTHPGKVWIQGSMPGRAAVLKTLPSVAIRHTNTAPTMKWLATDTILALEDVPGRVTVAGEIRPGGIWDSLQNVKFRIKPVLGGGLFDSLPTISAQGVFVYASKKDSSGLAKFLVQIRDDGDTLNGGTDSGESATLVVKIRAVNDPPVIGALPRISVPLGPDWYVLKDSLDVEPGPTFDERYQNLSFRYEPANEVAKNCIDSIQTFWMRMPVDPSNKYSKETTTQYTRILANRSCSAGVASIRMVVHDNGTTIDGAVDSASALWNITLTDSVVIPQSSIKPSKSVRYRKLGDRYWTFQGMNDDDLQNTVDPVAAAKTCPANWRLPTPDEWRALVDTFGFDAIRSTSGWVSGISGGQVIPPNNGTNTFGFNLETTETIQVPAAGSTIAKVARYVSYQWTSSAATPFAVFYRDLQFTSMFSSPYPQASRVRCVR